MALKPTETERSLQMSTIEEALAASSDFLVSYLHFANAHPVDFIVEDLWNKILPESIKQELSALNKEELYLLPSLNSVPAKKDACHGRQHDIASTSGDGCDKTDNLPTELLRLQLQPDTENRQQPRTTVSKEGKDREWEHQTITEFLKAAHKLCIENLSFDTSLEKLNTWLLEKDEINSERKPFVHAFMKEKKMHEVEVMADICCHIFHKTSADVVVDMGSGKGYLSTHLSLQCGLPVLGIDSQPHNTSGAARRAEKLGRQWDSLVKHEERKLKKKSQGQKNEATLKNTCEKNSGMMATVNDDAEGVDSKLQDNVVALTEKTLGTKVRDDECCTVHVTPREVSNGLLAQVSCDCPGTDRPAQAVTCLSQGASDITASPNTETLTSDISSASDAEPCLFQTGSKEPEKSSGNQNERINPARAGEGEEDISTNSFTKPNPTVAGEVGKHPGNSMTSNPKSKSPKPGRCVAMTTYVSADTSLVDLVEDSAGVLCPDKPPAELRLLLTGLHTCGPLAPSMLRLFSQDHSVRAVCGVGCCYQLMQELFADESGRWQDPVDVNLSNEKASQSHAEKEGDFPMSRLLLKRQMSMGRVAFNLASLALPRMTMSEEELQGKTFYPRALLQAFIHSKLGYVPQDLKRLRKLAKKASSPIDYVVRAVQKLNITGCEATEEEVAAFHQRHADQEDKMAAFFQLRAALAPLVETVVLLDRLLFLLEQDCVGDAFLVRVFEPITSPRCYALVAAKDNL